MVPGTYPSAPSSSLTAGCRPASDDAVVHLLVQQIVQRALTVHREVRGTVEGRNCIREGLGVQGCRVTFDAIAFFLIGLFTTGLFGRQSSGPGLGNVLQDQALIFLIG